MWDWSPCKDPNLWKPKPAGLRSLVSEGSAPVKTWAHTCIPKSSCCTALGTASRNIFTRPCNCSSSPSVSICSGDPQKHRSSCSHNRGRRLPQFRNPQRLGTHILPKLVGCSASEEGTPADNTLQHVSASRCSTGNPPRTSAITFLAHVSSDLCHFLWNGS